MKLTLVLPRWPAQDEDDALGTRALAGGLCEHGDEVGVLAGSTAAAHGPGSGVPFARERIEARAGATMISIDRIVRGDPCADHWQKSRSSAVGALIDASLREALPEVVVVAGWRGLVRDLVQRAARARIPAVVLLDPIGPSCLIHTRRRPESGERCDAVLAAHPCLACAQRAGPKTPWVPIEAQHIAFAEHQNDVVRELALARAVLVASAEDAVRMQAWIGMPTGPTSPTSSGFQVASGAERVARVRTACRAAIEAGAPPIEAERGDWYGERMRAFAEGEWDRRALAQQPA